MKRADYVFIINYISFLTEHSPVSTSKNVGYIVAAVIIEDGNVLMIRESKRSCYGQWYLPAGKMKGNESIEVNFPVS